RLLDLHDEWNEAEVQESEGFIGFSKTFKKEELELKDHVIRLLDLHDEWNEAEVQESEDPISFEDDGNGDNVGDDDEKNRDDGGGNVDNDANDGNGDEEDVNEDDKDPNGSNSSFGFSKISLEDFGNDNGPAEKDKGDLFGDNSATLEAMNQEITPKKLPTQKASSSPQKRSGDKILTKTTTMIILDNSPGTYDSKYKEFCDLLVAKVKHTIPKLKWKAKKNFHDCGIFPMLHMETFDGGPASNLDFGLLVESQLQCDMLRRLRFKFATKILLHEINVHAGKMLELAKEFDKTDHVEKMAIIIDAFKKREERDWI
nr:hypothetical protein [Tanacetum cinerariifolium]